MAWQLGIAAWDLVFTGLGLELADDGFRFKGFWNCGGFYKSCITLSTLNLGDAGIVV